MAGIILGILWTRGGVAMLMMLPAPTWVAVADVLLYVPVALLGVKLGALSGRSQLPVATQRANKILHRGFRTILMDRLLEESEGITALRTNNDPYHAAIEQGDWESG